MLTRVSVISDRPDYSSVYVSDGKDIVELAGGPPWRTLFRAMLKLKILQLKRRHHATERKTNNEDSISAPVPARQFGLSGRGKILVLSPKASGFPGRHQVLGVHGKSVDQLSGARPAKADPAGTQMLRIEGDRQKDTEGELTNAS
jgi:hypothetical protein